MIRLCLSLMSPIMTLTKAYSMRLRNTKMVHEDMNMSIACTQDSYIKGTVAGDFSHHNFPPIMLQPQLLRTLYLHLLRVLICFYMSRKLSY